MDSTPQSPASAAPPSGLSLLEMSSWIGYQVDNWVDWGESRDEDWLSWPTRNPRNPTLGSLFLHSFSPLHRYTDQVAGVEPADDSLINTGSWVALSTWARQCQQRHYDVSATLSPEECGRRIQFLTRSAGILHVTVSEALTHACTHCAWHLGGIAHLLRLADVEPPQRSDMIFWAEERHKLLDGAV